MHRMRSADPRPVHSQGGGEAVARRMSEVRHLRGSADWKLLRTKKLGLLQGRLPSVRLLG